jgi:NADH dehydrogenase
MKVAIIGGGFGGVTAAREFLKHKVEVTLFSKSEEFTFTPLLVSSLGELTPDDIAYNIPKELGNRIGFVRSNVEKIDLEKKVLSAGGKRHRYDYLLIAIGSQPNFFGIEGAKENCRTLKTADDARKIKIADGAEYVIVGAGPTGIELAGQISDMAPRSNITLVEGRDMILQQASDKVRSIAVRKLEQKKIKVVLDSRVTKVTAELLEMNGKDKIGSKDIFWTAGVKPNSIITHPALADKSGHIPVDDYLEIAGAHDAFCIGDCSLFIQDGKPLPDFAQVTVKQAKTAVKNILAKMDGKEMEKFVYHSDGFILSLGQNDGVAEVKGIVLSGYLAALVHKFVYAFKMPKDNIKTFFKLL